jgi:hypothetical protein
MSRIQSIRRLAGFVAGLATALLAAALTAPAALAVRVPPPGGTSGDSPPVVIQTRAVVEGGMPGWQIALIAAGAAVAAAALAVLADRARLASRHPATTVAAPAPTRVG